MSKNIYRIKVSYQADNALDAHMMFLSRVSPNAAVRQKEKIISNISHLSRNPYLYPVYETDSDMIEYRKMVIGRYAILYSVNEKDKTVGVDLVWDSRMDNVL